MRRKEIQNYGLFWITSLSIEKTKFWVQSTYSDVKVDSLQWGCIAKICVWFRNTYKTGWELERSESVCCSHCCEIWKTHTSFFFLWRFSPGSAGDSVSCVSPLIVKENRERFYLSCISPQGHICGFGSTPGLETFMLHLHSLRTTTEKEQKWKH